MSAAAANAAIRAHERLNALERKRDLMSDRLERLQREADRSGDATEYDACAMQFIALEHAIDAASAEFVGAARRAGIPVRDLRQAARSI